ncbi:MAG TPA: PSD1 and planctomycete cytochrome C domain-containing protein [Pirellulaceae bacterium]|nr:PSD1 and planctomycete cytochrome C domain-containing protein [Pirellulaceae bacterium]
MRCATIIPAFGVLVALACATVASSSEHDDFFEREVRPILVDKCLSCHGAKKQEGNLRLDSRAAVLQGGDGGLVAIAGQPPASRLVDAIRYGDELQMPPDGQLKEGEIAALVRWIELELPWPANQPLLESRPDASETHWAFQPVQKPAMPFLETDTWSRTAIDRFILAKLRDADVSPSEPAVRHALIRRASFDLIGLPPTPDEISMFVKDNSPNAFEKLVDRLLASPRYGERWARHWLDVARYADNKGYVFFEDKKYPWAYTYRDYVIRALNDDVPYDRFVCEQLAADQLDLGDDKRALTAMGFLTLGGHFMNNTHDIMDDRIDVVTRGLMGLTVTCARCHDHKYDPVSQADYYSLYGVFRSSFEPTVPPLFETPPATDEYRKFAEELATREKALVDFVTDKHRELVTDARTRIAEYLLAAHARRGLPPADDFMLLTDKGDINPAMILRWQTYLESPKRPHDRVWSVWRAMAALPVGEFSQTADEIIDGLAASQVNRLVGESLRSERPQTIEAAARVYAKLLVSVNEKWLSAVKAAPEANPPAALDDPDEEELRQVLYGPDAPPDAPLALDWGFLSLFPDRPTQGEYQKLIKAVEEWSSTGAGAPARAMVLYDAESPHEPRLFKRGNPNQLGDVVPRQFPQFFAARHAPFQNGSGRLELAEAIVDENNPLTARVIVNRIWAHHFGRGLVGTPSDFGLRSDPPSHPELLDYLAATFVAEGWSIKALHRRIMTSSVYRQMSVNREDATRVDPENRLLWKMNRRRLDFESLRDVVLAVSDNLTTEMYGPALDLFGGNQSHPRRSIYGFIDRLDVSPLLTTFDFPNPIASSPQRDSTTVPPQALYLMNNPFAATAARELAKRLQDESPDSSGRIGRAYEVLFGREPTEGELVTAQEFLGAEADEAALSLYLHGLLMTNEFAFID